ncbi:MAG: zf-HC2 domain-containing protein [Acidobacteria bacterium]|nr:zf-HC2 domain-containing protein [Acidobacteriota bacterium]
MQKSEQHVVLLEAIRYIDGELPPAEMTRIELHIHQCSDCRHRMSGIDRSAVQLRDLFARSKQTDGNAAVREQLMVKLLEAEQERHTSPIGWLIVRRRIPQMAAAVIVIALALAGIGKTFGSGSSRPTSAMAMLPDRGLTPGVVRQVALQELCMAQDDDDLDPAVPSSIQKKVFHEYGVSSERQGTEFQVDYLINPQLGGTNDIHNLWPQPYHSSQWNAEAKDALERHLHRMVCDGKIDLAEAQRDISTNWIVAYQKYFHTTKPV